MLEQLPTRCLTTPRLRLRTPTAYDLKALLPIFQDRETLAYTWFTERAGQRWTEASLLQLFERQAVAALDGRRADWVIHLADPHETTIGRCALFRSDVGDEWELGITISAGHQQVGYGEEVIRAVFGFAWKVLSAPEVLVQVLPDNHRMQRLCSRLALPLRTPAQHATPSGPLALKYDQYVVDTRMLADLSNARE